MYSDPSIVPPLWQCNGNVWQGEWQSVARCVRNLVTAAFRNYSEPLTDHRKSTYCFFDSVKSPRREDAARGVNKNVDKKGEPKKKLKKAYEERTSRAKVEGATTHCKGLLNIYGRMRGVYQISA